MPICYDINIDIVRTDEDGDEETVILPVTIQSDKPLTWKEADEKTKEAFADFMTKIIQYDPSRENDYQMTKRYVATAIYQC
jgi:hypothetical protein